MEIIGDKTKTNKQERKEGNRMIKKVGIITFHASHNCGSILQAYSLQKILHNRFNMESEIINFSNRKQQEMYSVYCKNNNIRKMIKNVIAYFHSDLLRQHYEDYNNFINEKLVLSKDQYSEAKELAGIEKNYSLLISGGDQIWNIKCYDADDAYFLNFASNVKKIAYAPSLGAINILKYAKDPGMYRRFLSDYKYLSVREYNGQRWLEELTGNKIAITADPTLLISKEEWEKEIGERIVKDDYIFYYSFHYPHEVNKVIKKISKKTGLPVVMLDAKAWAIRGVKYNGFEITPNGGPDIFLNLMKHAKLVLTLSLHGTIFSAALEKSFWYLDSSLHNDDDDRASFLLNQLNLTQRFVHIKDIMNKDLFEEIDYQTTRRCINEMQIKSLEYLEEAITEDLSGQVIAAQ
jgi:hypothetical protein